MFKQALPENIEYHWTNIIETFFIEFKLGIHITRPIGLIDAIELGFNSP